MGNNVGYVHENFMDLYIRNTDTTPGINEEPTFDPQLGFEKKRKIRVPQATKEELMSARIPLKDRDYCAHLLIKYRACRREVWPWASKCGHVKHEYLNCEYEDFLIRMKEYEREKRLRIREKKLKQLTVQE